MNNDGSGKVESNNEDVVDDSPDIVEGDDVPDLIARLVHSRDPPERYNPQTRKMLLL